jgi:hypothetical protein
MDTVSTGSVEYYAAVMRHNADTADEIRVTAIRLIDGVANLGRTDAGERVTRIRNILTAADQVEVELRFASLNGFLGPLCGDHSHDEYRSR